MLLVGFEQLVLEAIALPTETITAQTAVNVFTTAGFKRTKNFSCRNIELKKSCFCFQVVSLFSKSVDEYRIFFGAN